MSSLQILFKKKKKIKKKVTAETGKMGSFLLLRFFFFPSSIQQLSLGCSKGAE